VGDDYQVLREGNLARVGTGGPHGPVVCVCRVGVHLSFGGGEEEEGKGVEVEGAEGAEETGEAEKARSFYKALQ